MVSVCLAACARGAVVASMLAGLTCAKTVRNVTHKPRTMTHKTLHKVLTALLYADLGLAMWSVCMQLLCFVARIYLKNYRERVQAGWPLARE